MAGDFFFEKGVSFGERLHQQLFDAAYFESEPWAIDRIRRVVERLQAGRPDCERMVIEIPWIDLVTAFTAPGRYIYISRRLYERCGSDEQVAFIVAHEIAHHDLGHFRLLGKWIARLGGIPGASLFALAAHLLDHGLHGPEKECDADRYGLGLCLAAGYDGARCLELFDVLEHHALDWGDYDSVYSRDRSIEELEGKASWLSRARLWTWRRARGYLSLRERRGLLEECLQRRFAYCAR
jgi:predicted Zn-dependent protease